jgi:hypothetical protein
MFSYITVLVDAGLIWGMELGNKGSIRAEHFDNVADMTQRRPKRQQSTNTYCDFRSIGTDMRLKISSLF